MTKDIQRTILVCAIFALYILGIELKVPSQDFNAVWMAGVSVANGALDQIYPETDGVFALQAPQSWNAQLQASGAEGAIYPFIYPPLWAWAAQALPKITDLQTAVAVFFIFNTAALIAIALLSWRINGRRGPLALHMAIALGIFAVTTAGRAALGNNQPQILVTLLVLGAIERVMAGRSTVGGVLMALAASIKGLPLLYAALWLFQSQWRATVGFCVAGAALALASVALMGWPLHETFLSLLGDIRNSYLVLWLNITFDGMIGGLFFMDQRVVSEIAVVGEDPVVVRIAAAKTPLMAALSTVMMLLTLTGCAVIMHRNRQDPLVWPLVLILLSITSPLAWSYHYLAALAFLPCLLSRFSTLTAGIWIAAIILPMLAPVTRYSQEVEALLSIYRELSLLAMLAMAVAFGLAIRRGQPKG